MTINIKIRQCSLYTLYWISYNILTNETTKRMESKVYTWS